VSFKDRHYLHNGGPKKADLGVFGLGLQIEESRKYLDFKIAWRKSFG
jgi:hypothetical protein